MSRNNRRQPGTFVCVCLQCHEACIAIYSSMENQKLSHWVGISVLSMIFCLLIYTLTGEFPSEHLRCLRESPFITRTLSASRCVRLPDLRPSCRLRYFDVISRKWCCHDHFKATVWDIDCHYLSYYSSSGEVSDAGLICVVWLSVSTPHTLSLCPRRRADLSSSTWCCVSKDTTKASSLTRLRAAAESSSLWSGSLSLCSLPCLSLTWVRSSASSEGSVPSSSLFSLVCKHTLTCSYVVEFLLYGHLSMLVFP